MAETHSEFYTADIGGVQTWRVESHTARTWKVVRELTHGHQWRRTVRTADIGHTYHITPLAALNAVRDNERNEIRMIKDRLQRKRTALGMVESEMRRLPGGAQLLALDEPVSVNAGATPTAEGAPESAQASSSSSFPAQERTTP
jgi:hypothetical protein